MAIKNSELEDDLFGEVPPKPKVTRAAAKPVAQAPVSASDTVQPVSDSPLSVPGKDAPEPLLDAQRTDIDDSESSSVKTPASAPLPSQSTLPVTPSQVLGETDEGLEHEADEHVVGGEHTPSSGPADQNAKTLVRGQPILVVSESSVGLARNPFDFNDEEEPAAVEAPAASRADTIEYGNDPRATTSTHSIPEGASDEAPNVIVSLPQDELADALAGREPSRSEVTGVTPILEVDADGDGIEPADEDDIAAFPSHEGTQTLEWDDVELDGEPTNPRAVSPTAETVPAARAPPRDDATTVKRPIPEPPQTTSPLMARTPIRLAVSLGLELPSGLTVSPELILALEQFQTTRNAAFLVDVLLHLTGEEQMGVADGLQSHPLKDNLLEALSSEQLIALRRVADPTTLGATISAILDLRPEAVDASRLLVNRDSSYLRLAKSEVDLRVSQRISHVQRTPEELETIVDHLIESFRSIYLAPRTLSSDTAPTQLSSDEQTQLLHYMGVKIANLVSEGLKGEANDIRVRFGRAVLEKLSASSFGDDVLNAAIEGEVYTYLVGSGQPTEAAVLVPETVFTQLASWRKSERDPLFSSFVEGGDLPISVQKAFIRAALLPKFNPETFPLAVLRIMNRYFEDLFGEEYPEMRAQVKRLFEEKDAHVAQIGDEEVPVRPLRDAASSLSEGTRRVRVVRVDTDRERYAVVDAANKRVLEVVTDDSQRRLAQRMGESSDVEIDALEFRELAERMGSRPRQKPKISLTGPLAVLSGLALAASLVIGVVKYFGNNESSQQEQAVAAVQQVRQAQDASVRDAGVAIDSSRPVADSQSPVSGSADAGIKEDPVLTAAKKAENAGNMFTAAEKYLEAKDTEGAKRVIKKLIDETCPKGNMADNYEVAELAKRVRLDSSKCDEDSSKPAPKKVVKSVVEKPKPEEPLAGKTCTDANLNRALGGFGAGKTLMVLDKNACIRGTTTCKRLPFSCPRQVIAR